MDTLETFVFIIIIIIAMVIGYVGGLSTERKILINKLCNKQQYDFCVIKEYTLKE